MFPSLPLATVPLAEPHTTHIASASASTSTIDSAKPPYPVPLHPKHSHLLVHDILTTFSRRTRSFYLSPVAAGSVFAVSNSPVSPNNDCAISRNSRADFSQLKTLLSLVSNMDASNDGSESVDQFLARISSLNAKQGHEEAERSRKMEEEMLQARKERQARRAGMALGSNIEFAIDEADTFQSEHGLSPHPKLDLLPHCASPEILLSNPVKL